MFKDYKYSKKIKAWGGEGEGERGRERKSEGGKE